MFDFNFDLASNIIFERTIKIIVLIFTIYLFILIISLWKLFKKEEIKPWYSFIPFLNIYYLLKICKLPFYLIFIPLVNILVFLLYPYKLAKQYRCNNFLSFLSIIFPYFIIPYIAFSKHENKDKIYNPNYLKTIDDVNKLENNLINDNDYIVDDVINDVSSKNNKNEQTHLNDLVEKIDSSIINDEYVYDEPETVLETKEEKPTRDFVDLNNDNPISLDDVEVLESDIKTNVNQNFNVKTDIKDYNEKILKDTEIAFGGQELDDAKIDAKVEDLKCIRCGASLVGNNGSCPGCGMKL